MQSTTAFLLAGMLGLCCLLQAVLIHRTAVPARDAVRLAGMAQAMEQDGILATIRTRWQQPLFPLWVCVVHLGLRQTAGEFPAIWALSVQVAAAAALVLTLVPLYFLLCRLVGAAGAAAGTMLFCLLPEVARLGADGISDSTHLLWFCVALWAIVEYLERRRAGGGRRKAEGGGAFSGSACAPLWLLLAGVATALAMLTRGEALVLLGALPITLVLAQRNHSGRRSWKSLIMAGACFLLGLAVVLGPYFVAVGSLTPSLALHRVLGRPPASFRVAKSPVVAIDHSAWGWRLAGGEPVSFDTKEHSQTIRQRGYAAATARFSVELVKAFGYWPAALALWGAWRLHGKWTLPAHRFMQVFFVLFSAAVIHFAAAEGYLAARYLLPVVVTGMGAAGYGAVEIGRAACHCLARSSSAHNSTARLALRQAVAWTACVLLGITCLLPTLVQCRGSRLGHRAAGAWLAEQADGAVSVLDTFGWTGLYSGRSTYLYEDAPTALRDPALAYLVLEEEESRLPSPRGRTLRWLGELAGPPVARFPEPGAQTDHQRVVVVYRWRPGVMSRR